MGCCGSSDVPVITEQRPMTLARVQEFTVYGDYFDSDTRTILTLLNLVEQKHKFQEVDQFQGHQTKADFLSVNPIGTVPVMLDGSFKILGATKVFLNYLANTYPKVSTRFP